MIDLSARVVRMASSGFVAVRLVLVIVWLGFIACAGLDFWFVLGCLLIPPTGGDSL
jgi:hypothetical protein